MPNLKTYPITDEIARQMLNKAEVAKKNTYPDPGAFTVVALSKNGNMYEGVSYNSTTYTLTMHSEATALAHAAIHGEKDIIAITGPNCHICKQLIWESALRSGIDVQVVMKIDCKITLVPISQQMPFPWPEK